VSVIRTRGGTYNAAVLGLAVVRASILRYKNRLLSLLRKFFVITKEQDRQCTYNVILRRVRVTIVALEKQ
jgi:hypothetical protein